MQSCCGPCNRHVEQLIRMVQTSKMGTLSIFHTPLYEALHNHSTTLSAVFGEAELHVAMTEPAGAPAREFACGSAAPHSARSASTGSTAVARRAGR